MARGAPTFTIARALEAMRGRRALLVGDFMLDAYLYGETVRVSREAPVLVVRKERLEHRLGGAANTAANLAAFGVATQLVGAIGADPAGDTLRDLLRAAGADTAGLQQVETTTPVKTRVLAGAFGTSKQQVLRLDDEPTEPLADAALAAIARELAERAGDVDVVVVSDYGVGAVAGPVIGAVRRAAQEGRLVCVDSRFQLPEFGGVTAVTPNVPEAEGAVGFPITRQTAVERAGTKLVADLGCQACLLTQGRHGMTLFRRGEASCHVDIVGDEEVTDVTGAGDTVLATFSAALAAGLGMENGMRLANCAAGIVVTKAGTATASFEEICDAADKGGVTLLPWK